MKPLKLNKKQKGAEIVEFAIMLPVLMLVLLSIMEFGLILYDKALITNACREAARSGIVFKCPLLTTQNIKDVVTRYTSYANGNSLLVSFGSGSTSPSVTVAPTPSTDITKCGNQSGTPLTVTVTYNYNFLALGNLIGVLVPGFTNPMTISAITVMNYE